MRKNSGRGSAGNPLILLDGEEFTTRTSVGLEPQMNQSWIHFLQCGWYLCLLTENTNLLWIQVQNAEYAQNLILTSQQNLSAGKQAGGKQLSLLCVCGGGILIDVNFLIADNNKMTFIVFFWWYSSLNVRFYCDIQSFFLTSIKSVIQNHLMSFFSIINLISLLEILVDHTVVDHKPHVLKLSPACSGPCLIPLCCMFSCLSSAAPI